ncbi:MAG: PilZ domain-containing protein [Candidatus Omnitrophica bacterium]|nr:PilZ domain-containing protein [Candidatus Omnitrophota bacterium]
MQERRRFPRINSTNITEIEPRPVVSDIQAITKDISQAGACIYSDTYLEPGKFTRIRMHKENQAFPEAKEAVVAWSKLSKDKFGSVFQIGLNIPE